MSEDQLDELLAKAEWPEFGAGRSSRVRRAYLERRGGSSWGWVRVAAGVAILAAGGAVWWGMRKDEVERRPVEVVMVKQEKAAVPSRPANVAELVVMRSAVRTFAGNAPKVEAVAKAETLESLLKDQPARGVEKCMALAASGKEGEAVEALKTARGKAIDLLFAKLDDPKVTQREVAARLLGKVDGAVVTERLAKLVEQNRNRREAMAALMQSDGAEAQEVVKNVMTRNDLAAVARSVAQQLKGL